MRMIRRPARRNGAFPSCASSTYASPSLTADGVIFAPAAPKFTALRPAKNPDDEPQVLWESIKLRPGYSSPIAHQGLIYTVATAGIVHCADAKTGDILWTHRLDGPFAASPLLADGKLYLVNEKGVTTILQAGKELNVLATNAINDVILATPVASDGAIFLRSDGALYCIGAKK